MRKRAAYKTRNESYAGRRLAKLTRGCGMRHEGGMAMQIYSKVERALGSIHILRLVLLSLRVPPIFSLRLFLAVVLRPEGRRRPRLCRDARIATKNGQLCGRKFGNSDDSFRPTVKISSARCPLRGNRASVIESRIGDGCGTGIAELSPRNIARVRCVSGEMQNAAR